MRPLAYSLAALTIVLALSGCDSQPSGSTFEVDVRMVACAGDCLEFPLPNAAVQVLSDSDKPVSSGHTDETGEYRFKVSGGGTFHIVVKSPFLKGGMKDTYADGSGNGSDTTVTLLAAMSSTTIPALRTDRCRSAGSTPENKPQALVTRACGGCSPDGIRTHATALRGRRPRPLDDGAVRLC